ncbi:Sodium/potassium-transporting ATPase subunit gamma [Manis javanica]|nr:Sodium/potassium-transporting ATPase subunit gamma [Manis javanica]
MRFSPRCKPTSRGGLIGALESMAVRSDMLPLGRHGWRSWRPPPREGWRQFTYTISISSTTLQGQGCSRPWLRSPLFWTTDALGPGVEGRSATLLPGPGQQALHAVSSKDTPAAPAMDRWYLGGSAKGNVDPFHYDYDTWGSSSSSVKDSAVGLRNPGKSLKMSCNDGVSCAHHGPWAVGKPSLSCGPLHPALPLGSRKRRAP